MKRQRIVDESLLEQVRQLPCLACAASDPDGALLALESGWRDTHPHHLRSRGAGGDDVAHNILPLCFRHHREVHDKGLSHMNQKYPTVATWLTLAEWEFDNMLGWHREEKSDG